MPEGEGLILPGGDEFLGDIALESSVEDCPHDPGVIDFLVLIKFSPAGISSGMIVANDFLVLLNSANHIPVHHLNMVDIEE